MTPKPRFSRITLALFLTILLTISACSNSQSQKPTQPIAPTLTPFTPAPGFNVTIPSKGLLKNYLVVSAEAAPGTQCTLTFIPKSGEMLVMEAVANTEGECVWRWKLEESYGRGAARLIFTIDGVSDTHFIEIHSSF